VSGSVATNGGGNATVTLTGAAAFTSGTSYVCTATGQANGAGAAAITSQTATAFNIRGTGSTSYAFICVGT